MSENFPVFESSPEMKAAAVRGGRDKYPWKTLAFGQSFVVGKVADTGKNFSTLLTLQSLCYRHGKNLKKKFRVIERDDHFEVGCTDVGTNTGSFSTALDPAIAQRVEQPTGNAPIGWPVIKKEGE